MKVILFYPRGASSSGTQPVSSLAACLPPIGLASVAAVLRRAGHDVVFFDAVCRPEVADSVWVKKIIDEKPDFVGFSAITASFTNACAVCCAVKEACSATKTVFGGVHVSWGKETILTEYPAIDFVIAGEGEFAFLDLVNGKAPETIAGLFFRDGTRIKHGPDQDKKSLCVMDDLPFPAYDLLDGFPKKYNLPLFSYPRHPGASVISSRGCVYQCDFCDRSVFQKSFRWNSPEYTFELIKWLNTDFGVRHILFYDDLFTLDRSRVEKFCGLLRNHRPRITYNCIVRVGHIDDGLIQELKSSGCWMVNVGIESGDQNILDENKDGLSLETIRRDIHNLHSAGIWVKGLFMMGFPHETEASIQKTLEFACSLPLKDANITAFTPFPGSPVYKRIEEYGAFDKDPQNWEKMDCVNFVFLPKSIESGEILTKQYREFIRRFYNRPFMRKVYRKMLLESPHSYWRLIKHASAFLGYAKSMK